MKYCPTCRISYTDDSQQFCFHDGTELSIKVGQDPDTVVLKEFETVVRNKNDQTPFNIAPPVIIKNSNAFLTILLTVFIMLFIGAVVVALWLYTNKNNEIAYNTGDNSVSKSLATPSPVSSVRESPPPPQSNVNSTNLSFNSPEISAVDLEQVKTEVQNKVFSWKAAAESRDLNSYMNNYADRVNYYRAKNASRDFVRNDKQRAFTSFDTIRINITNLRVVPDPDGQRATAVLDKEWDFTGPQKNISGKVQTQLQLVRLNGQWRITSEKDLKTYYVNK